LLCHSSSAPSLLGWKEHNGKRKCDLYIQSRGFKISTSFGSSVSETFKRVMVCDAREGEGEKERERERERERSDG
jgi:hypothetical protein